RDLIVDVPLSPMRAKNKVYVVRDAGRLWGTSANALLKTLEEPPQGVVFILLAPSVDSVLETIASRCQQIPFVAAEASGTDPSASGAIAGAAARIPLAERSEAARLAIECTLTLPALDSWDVIGHAKRIVAAVKAPLEDLKEEQAARDEGIDEFLTARALKELADTRRRELTQHERSGMMEVPVAVESVLRDLLLCSMGQESDIVNTDIRTELTQLSRSLEPEQAIRALEACGRSQDRLSSGVTPQLALEAMFLQVKEALTCHS
ncbi:MAG: DNA polymerase III subunit delta', partial [Atopobiaceae bacterium]|nr:DNA polymerase III subunit delta' [Atopobiaceae bacterium]